MIRHILNVFKKERVDTLRDKRTIFAALAYAFFGPGLLMVVLNYLATQAADESSPRLAVEGMERAPFLMEHLEGEDVVIIEVAPEGSLKEKLGNAHALLVVDENYQADIAKGGRGTIYLYVDRTDNQGTNRAGTIRVKINQFINNVGEARLLAMGVPPSLVVPIQVEVRDVSPAGRTAKTISFLMIYFFVLAPFFSSLSVSIDTTAGERERRSLQSLLAQPVSPLSLIVGKWMIAVLFGMVGTSVAVLGGMYAMSFTPLEVLGISFHLNGGAMVSMLGSLLPLTFFVAALQVWISLSAKSYKEANTYLQLFSFAPVLIGLTLSLTGKDITGAAGYLPVVAHLQSTQKVLISGSLNTVDAFIYGGVCLLLAVLFLLLAAKRLGSEKILTAA